MEQEIKLKFYNAKLNIGMAHIREVFLLAPFLTPLQSEVYRGKLVYREKGSAKIISYFQLKKGLVKRAFTVTEQVPDWLLE